MTDPARLPSRPYAVVDPGNPRSMAIRFLTAATSDTVDLPIDPLSRFLQLAEALRVKIAAGDEESE